MLAPFEIRLPEKQRVKYRGELPIGSGGCNTVLPGVLTRKNGERVAVAIKCCLHNRSEEAAQRLKSELKILREVSGHPNVVPYLGSKLTRWGKGVYVAKIVLERMGMDLQTLIFRNEDFGRSCTYADLLRVFVQMFTGLQYLHNREVVHFDVKPSSVLVTFNVYTREITLKLGGFRNSKTLQEDKISAPVSFEGTMVYMSPEMLRRNLLFGDSQNRTLFHPKAADVYSAGVVMWECLNRSAVGVESTLRETGRKIGWPDGVATKQIWCEAPPPLCDLIEDCLKREPSERPTSTQVLARLEAMMNQHEWVDKRVPTFDSMLENDELISPMTEDRLVERVPPAEKIGCFGEFFPSTRKKVKGYVWNLMRRPQQAPQSRGSTSRSSSASSSRPERPILVASGQAPSRPRHTRSVRWGDQQNSSSSREISANTKSEGTPSGSYETENIEGTSRQTCTASGIGKLRRWSWVRDLVILVLVWFLQRSLLFGMLSSLGETTTLLMSVLPLYLCLWIVSVRGGCFYFEKGGKNLRE